MVDGQNNFNSGNNAPPPAPAGQSQATASLVLGIVSIVMWFFGYTSLLSVGLGIAGIVMAVNSKRQGFSGPIYTAGLVTSIVGVVVGAMVFLFFIALAGLFTALIFG